MSVAPALSSPWSVRLRQVAGVILGVIAALWLRSLRVRVWVDPRLLEVSAVRVRAREGVRERPWVLSFFHGTQFPLLAWRRRKRTVVMVSHSQDGAMQAMALRGLGFGIVRGSSSRGGVRGLAALIRQMKRRDADAAFAVDGPRGPYGKVKEGAILAARATSGLLVPMGSSSARAWIASRAWDKFTLPLPFSRVQIVLGAPLSPEALALDALAPNGSMAEALERAIASANETAQRLLDEERSSSRTARLNALAAREGSAHGDRVGELEVSAVRNAAGDT